MDRIRGFNKLASEAFGKLKAGSLFKMEQEDGMLPEIYPENPTESEREIFLFIENVIMLTMITSHHLSDPPSPANGSMFAEVFGRFQETAKSALENDKLIKRLMILLKKIYNA